ncbi:hypothetical protein [Euzebya tangerina]|uniref:hypothetical protein n=1 Tax=Euzebya tangerina TaxID=591198 RepID=UPI000E315EAA|nr:hypothetical protein [Euzebya tangerina]
MRNQTRDGERGEHAVARWSTAASLLLLVTVLLSVAVPLRTSRAPTSDGRQYVAAAANLAVSGVFSTQLRPDGGSPTPNARREPLYPAILALGIEVIGADSPDLACLLDASRSCRDHLRALRLINVMLLVALGLSTRVLARQVGLGRWLATCLGIGVGLSTVFTSDVDEFFSTTTAATLLTAAAALLHQVVTDGRRRAPVLLAGVMLGLLMLTRASFMVSGLVLVPAAWLASRWDSRGAGRRCIAVLLISWMVASPWMARNAALTGSPALTSGASRVLAVRAEASTMSWAEYPWAFVVYTPELGERIVRAAPEAPWRRWDRRQEPSFYGLALGLDPGGEVQQRAGADVDRLGSAAAAVIADNPVEFAALTLPYAWRGLFGEAGRQPLQNQGTEMADILARWLAPLVGVALIALVPASIITITRVLRHRDAAVMMMLSLVAGSYVFHAATTHFIRRYSHPFVPVLVVTVVWVLRRDYRTAAADDVPS